MESPDHLEQRIRTIEATLGIAGVTAPATQTIAAALPIGTIVITATDTCGICFGTWEYLTKGDLFGQVGAYAWQRTA